MLAAGRSDEEMYWGIALTRGCNRTCCSATVAAEGGVEGA